MTRVLVGDHVAQVDDRFDARSTWLLRAEHPASVRIWLATEPVDMRMSFRGLSGSVRAGEHWTLPIGRSRVRFAQGALSSHSPSTASLLAFRGYREQMLEVPLPIW